MKTVLAFVIVLFALQLNAQCDKIYEEDSAKLFNKIENNQVFEEYDEVFLFKNSTNYFALNCKRNGENPTHEEKRYIHYSFTAKKCSFEKLNENLHKKYLFANIK